MILSNKYQPNNVVENWTLIKQVDKPIENKTIGKVACAECKRSGECRVCGRQETTFCEKCENRRFENDKASTTL